MNKIFFKLAKESYYALNYILWRLGFFHLHYYPKKNKKYYLSVCTIAKNEQDYLLEWIAFNKVAVGAEHIWLYDNNSKIPVKETVKKYIDEGYVDVIDWPRNRGNKQTPAYNHFLKNFGAQTQWTAFIDIDEYIVNKTDKSISEILEKFWKKRAGSFQIAWKMFGSNGHRTKPQGLTLENFTMADTGGHRWGTLSKSICQPHAVYRFFSVHYPILKLGYVPLSEDMSYFNSLVFKNFIGKDVQLNHYFTRSLEEFEKKIKRGRADIEEKRDYKEEVEFVENICNTLDVSALKYAAPIKVELARIQS